MSNRKSKQQIFFLTKLDIVKMMSIVKRRIPIEYVLMGSFDSEIVRRENPPVPFHSKITITKIENQAN